MLSDLKLYQKIYDFLLWVKPTVEKFARAHKYGLGIQLENETINLLKIVARNNIRRDKSELAEDCLVQYETVKLLIRLSRDLNLISVKQYEFSSQALEEIGRLLGGWVKKFQQICLKND